MKIVNKASAAVLGLVFMGSSVFAQSLADAKKAIDAEQYQKAKSMLKNLTVTQSTKDENYFYLGLVYLKQDYADSARATFNKGIAVNPKSALNLVGLGTVDRIEKNEASAKANFDKAMSLAGKDDKPYIYIAKAYIMKPVMAKEAMAVLEKAKTLSKDVLKDPDLFSAFGNVYSAQGDASNAADQYLTAVGLDPNSPVILVNLGVIWKQANNYEDATAKFKEALTKDPNFGPAYREMAESDLKQAANDPKVTVAKRKEGADYYKKYIDLTDRSIESRVRYADFLITAGDFKQLEIEATELAKLDKANLKVYRYLAIADYENGNYAPGLAASNKFIKEADAKRILPVDYVYQGRLLIKTNQDSLGILALQKAVALDTTQADLYKEIGASLYAAKKYPEAGDAYTKFVNSSSKLNLTERFTQGRAYYFGFEAQSSAALKNKAIKPDSSLLTKADSAFSFILQKTATKPFALAIIYRAYVNDEKETDREKNYKGYALPFYQKYVEIVEPTHPQDAFTKSKLVDSYTYLGYYNEFVSKDSAKAEENWAKAKELDPANKQVINYYARKGGSPNKGK
ncbi:MAG: tetratricopeptide repeat protein [Mucilaginibacter sp.]|uniref:tetratricopeptide repeat protein n=1 Tax=Mucilaginibacter sp. TaxID=1882438 RepID=UPI0032637AC8